MINSLPTRRRFRNERLVRSHGVVFEIRAFFGSKSPRTTQHLCIATPGQSLGVVADFLVEFFEVEFGGDDADRTGHCQFLWMTEVETVVANHC